MRPFEFAGATGPAVGPAVGVSLPGGPTPAGQLHVVVDSALGIVVGVVLVWLYLAALRRIDGPGQSADDRPQERDSSSPGQENDNS